jgi:hypothetical protein
VPHGGDRHERDARSEDLAVVADAAYLGLTVAEWVGRRRPWGWSFLDEAAWLRWHGAEVPGPAAADAAVDAARSALTAAPTRRAPAVASPAPPRDLYAELTRLCDRFGIPPESVGLPTEAALARTRPRDNLDLEIGLCLARHGHYLGRGR